MGPVKLRAACDCGERSGGDETLRLIMEGAVIGLGGNGSHPPPLNVFKKKNITILIGANFNNFIQ